ncbi:hypothetical protein RvY_00541 [Ramazzottius varieornatus]|uniref:Uncharacterized protein n=1 Tax=Ramazzottius varieornatus TaxID=947166 RepID=A0A1D1UDL4_RAMVA|nr:hypothetical protein RvY_00541 [Ramazzottius varieornatus]
MQGKGSKEINALLTLCRGALTSRTANYTSALFDGPPLLSTPKTKNLRSHSPVPASASTATWKKPNVPSRTQPAAQCTLRHRHLCCKPEQCLMLPRPSILAIIIGTITTTPAQHAALRLTSDHSLMEEEKKKKNRQENL